MSACSIHARSPAVPLARAFPCLPRERSSAASPSRALGASTRARRIARASSCRADPFARGVPSGSRIFGHSDDLRRTPRSRDGVEDVRSMARTAARVLASPTPSPRRARAPRGATRAAMSPSTSYVPQGPIERARVAVTGANRGIGLELCEALLARENVVEAGCRRASDALRALERSSDGRLIVSEGVDVGDDAAIDAWARAMTTRGRRLDVVVNNAGVVGTNGYDAWDLETTTAEEMMYVFKINCVGPTLVVRALLRHGLIGADANAPSLVGNVTSKVGSVEDNGSGRGYSYRASKSALNIVTKSMSIDLASRGVHFALLHPGWVKTDMTESRGLIDAEESARGLIRVLQGEFGDCERFWFDYKGDKIPW